MEAERSTEKDPVRSRLGVFGLGRLVLLRRGRWIILHAFFQSTNSFAQPLTKFRQFLRAKNQQGNSENDDQMCRLKQAFKHGKPPQNTQQLLYTVLDE